MEVLIFLFYSFSLNDLSNIQIEYYNNEIKVEIPYKVLIKEISKINSNKNLINHSEINYSFALPLPKRFLLKSHLEQINDINWDKIIKNDKNQTFAYKIDNINFVNIIYQETFEFSDLKKTTNFLDECFTKFDENFFPIIIIENFNNGAFMI